MRALMVVLVALLTVSSVCARPKFSKKLLGTIKDILREAFGIPATHDEKHITAADPLTDPGSPPHIGCTIKGKTYQKGESFFNGCSSCSCDGNDAISCTHLCTLSMVLCKSNEEVASRMKVVNPECSCPEPYCKPKPAPPPGCRMNGKMYEIGEKFYSNCDPCECTPFGLMCLPGCPLQGMPMCSPGQKMVEVKHKQAGAPDGCLCSFEECHGEPMVFEMSSVGPPLIQTQPEGHPPPPKMAFPPELSDEKQITAADPGSPPHSGCTIKGKTYQKGESFFLGCSSCSCDGNDAIACTHACTLSMVLCKSDAEVATRMVFVNPECSCPEPYCKPKPAPPPGCFFNGKMYGIGEKFYSDCDPCECGLFGLMCLPGCPLQGMPMCSPGQKIVEVKHKQAGAPDGCLCSFEECHGEAMAFPPPPKMAYPPAGHPPKLSDEKHITAADPGSPPHREPIRIADKRLKPMRMVGKPLIHHGKLPPPQIAVPPPHPDACTINGKTYKKGESFFNGCSSCSCDGNDAIACTHACTLSMVLCKSDAEVATRMVFVNPECSCPEPYCKPKPAPPPGCFFNRKMYAIGEKFYSDCDPCECGPFGVMCLPGCPLQGMPMCSPGQKMVEVKHKQAGAPDGCLCSFEECHGEPMVFPPLPAAIPPPMVKIVKKGTCKDPFPKDVCKSYAKQENLDFGSLKSSSYEKFPAGCYLKKKGKVIKVRYNEGTDKSPACGTKRHNCVCFNSKGLNKK